jgi:hypothetical protein
VVAEILELDDFVRARARRRARVLTERCLVLMEDSLTSSRQALGAASLSERTLWVHKIRQQEGLIAYTNDLV